MVSTGCFIAPNGDWYICCNDETQEKTLGNVYEKSLSEVYSGEARQRFHNLLVNGRFSEIGYPCSLVEACQNLPFTMKERLFIFADQATLKAKRALVN